MNIKVYVFSDKISKIYQSMIDEYVKRLSKYCKVKVILAKKGLMISDKEEIIIIDSSSNSLTSPDFAKLLDNYAMTRKSNISFIIGSDDYNGTKIALTYLDMNLDLTTSCLLEQIYRAYKILNNEPYHK